MEVKSLSRARLLATPWTAAYQAPLSMGNSKQEYWNGQALVMKRILLLEDRVSMSEEQNHSLMRTRDWPSETMCQGIQRTMVRPERGPE